MEKELIDKIKFLIKKGFSFEDICKKLELNEYEVIGIIHILKENGELIDYINGEIVKIKNNSYQNNVEIPIKKDKIKFLALSDLHYSSKWDNPHLVEYAYELAEKEDCDFITNSGDIFEGDFQRKRPDHVYQVKAIGLQQLDYVVNKYPVSDKPTYFIIGNHDETLFKTCGVDVGKLLSTQRPDLTYLGQDLGDINIGKTKIRLRHGSGGNAYAKGYKLQKYCETLSTSDLPTIILQGHFHYSAYFKNRDIHCFNVPSLQGYTPYAKSLGLPHELGFWLITCYMSERGGVVSIVPELYQFEEKKYVKRLKPRN